MNFSADPAPGKWPFGGLRCGKETLPVIAAVFFMVWLGFCLVSTITSAAVPLPRPRPPEAPQADPLKTEAPSGIEAPSGTETSPTTPATEAAAPKAPEPTPCRVALTDEIAIAPSIPSIHGPGACGGDDLVRLEAIVVSSERRVSLKPPAVLRCSMATAIANWVRTDMEPLAVTLGTHVSEVDNYDSYECRGRNRIKGAKLSEHGLANALDVRGFKFANGSSISLTDRNASHDTLEKVRTSVCGRFATVLGPGSDWYHEEHIHLDLAERRGNYKLCQWGIFDPLPAVAPLMPAERPDDAPAPVTADAKTGADAAPGNAAPPAADEPEHEGDADSKSSNTAPAKSDTVKKRAK
jgi:hypothetical protein